MSSVRWLNSNTLAFATDAGSIHLAKYTVSLPTEDRLVPPVIQLDTGPVNDQHEDAVTCLDNSRFASNVVVSGGADSTVRLWNVTGERLTVRCGFLFVGFVQFLLLRHLGY